MKNIKLNNLRIIKRNLSNLIGGISSNFFIYMCEDSSPFINSILKLKIKEITKGKLTTIINYNSILSGNPKPEAIHGGIIATIIDHTGGFCAWSILNQGGSYISTVDLKIDYINPLYLEEEGLICDSIITYNDIENNLIYTDMKCWNKLRTKEIALGRGVYINYQRKDTKGGGLSKFINMLFKYNNGILGNIFMKYFNQIIMNKHKRNYNLKEKKLNLNNLKNQHIHHHETTTTTTTTTSVNDLNDSTKLYNGYTYEEFCHEILTNTKFNQEILQFQIDSFKHGYLQLRLPYRPIFTGNYLTPCLHGGIPASFIDNCGGLCARTLLTSSLQRVSTVNLTIDYLVPAPCFEDILCEAHSEFLFPDLIFSQVVCWNQLKTQKLAISSVIFNVYTPKIT